MNLNKDKWLKEDIENFEKYLLKLEDKESISRSYKITKTKMNLLGIKSNILKNIAKEIFKGNYTSFLDYNLNNYYDELIINAYIINKIKDYDLKIKYLNEYIKNDLCWATCDVLKFNNDKRYLELSKEYLKNKNNFIVRIGIIILFSFIKSDLEEVLNIIKTIKSTDYYVNMAYAWLFCDIYIIDNNKAIEYIENNEINNFVINKFISKCNDSYRLTKEEKEKIKKTLNSK